MQWCVHRKALLTLKHSIVLNLAWHLHVAILLQCFFSDTLELAKMYLFILVYLGFGTAIPTFVYIVLEHSYFKYGNLIGWWAESIFCRCLIQVSIFGAAGMRTLHFLHCGHAQNVYCYAMLHNNVGTACACVGQLGPCLTVTHQRPTS